MSVGESKVFLPRGAAGGALRFQRLGVSGLFPSNIPVHKRITSQMVQQRRDHKSAPLVNFQLITRKMCTPGWVKNQDPTQ